MPNKINKLKLALKKFLKVEDIITKSPQITPYLQEKRGNFTSNTSLVVIPSKVTEVSQILQHCNSLKIGVVPLSGNTGLVGGGVSTNNQIILSLEKLNQVRDFDATNQTVTLEAGVPLIDAIELCQKHNLLFPLDLPSRKKALIGGNLATNAGGLNTIKYGQVKNFTLGLEVVLANGHIVSDLNKLTKRNLGPDYKNLFIGSEGILGIITAATFKLQPLPKQNINILLSTNTIEALIETFLKFRAVFANQISAFEVINLAAVTISLETYPSNFFPLKKTSPWYAVVTIDYYHNSSRNLLELQAFLGKLQGSEQLNEFYIENNTKAIWQFRDVLSKAQSKRGASIKHDIALPLSNITTFIKNTIKEITKVARVAMPVIFGHLGDQSLHFNFASKSNNATDNALLLELKPKINKLIVSLVMSYNGSFSAEHGIGLLYQKQLQKYYFNNQFYMINLLKKSLDPNNILNPSKIVKLKD